MKQTSVFKVDLTKIRGEGDFPCPSCGTLISPDDESEVIYDIVDVETEEDGSLLKITIFCKSCGSMIHLTGFEMLNGILDLEDMFTLDDYLLRDKT